MKSKGSSNLVCFDIMSNVGFISFQLCIALSYIGTLCSSSMMVVVR